MIAWGGVWLCGPYTKNVHTKILLSANSEHAVLRNYTAC